MITDLLQDLNIIVYASNAIYFTFRREIRYNLVFRVISCFSFPRCRWDRGKKVTLADLETISRESTNAISYVWLALDLTRGSLRSRTGGLEALP